MLSKTVAAALLGVSSFDVSDFTVTDIPSSSRGGIVITTVDTSPSVFAIAITKYLRGGTVSSSTTRYLQTTPSSALVTCILTLESSVYTYYETTQQFETSITDGTFNNWMRDYANYLQVYELNTTTIQSATYTDLSGQEENNNEKSTFISPTAIVGIVTAVIVVVCMIVYACAWFINGGHPGESSICRSFRQNCKCFYTLLLLCLSSYDCCLPFCTLISR